MSDVSSDPSRLASRMRLGFPGLEAGRRPVERQIAQADLAEKASRRGLPCADKQHRQVPDGYPLSDLSAAIQHQRKLPIGASFSCCGVYPDSRTSTLAALHHMQQGHDWDVGGTYTESSPCPACGGAGLRPEYAQVRLAGYTPQQLNEAPIGDLPAMLDGLATLIQKNGNPSVIQLAMPSLQTVQHRLHFLGQVGLGYLSLNRMTASLSAGEAQRIRLASLLGSELTSLTVLLDEPTRGLHPSEVQALLDALLDLRAAGNTVVVVEHDPLLMLGADHLIDMGPGAGIRGGSVVAQGSPADVKLGQTVTASWLRGERSLFPDKGKRIRRSPQSWMIIRGARANNLCGDEVRIPLGVMTGVCGVSGSGKSTLVMDTLGRVLVPKKYTTSVAAEPVDPGLYDNIEGAPRRALLIDQTKAGVTSPADYLDLHQTLIRIYAESEDAHALGLDAAALSRRCSSCGGSGQQTIDMGFLPDVHERCEICSGTGFLPEAWQVRLHGLTLPELSGKTIDECHAIWADEPTLGRTLAAARDVGLGYLVLRQPGYSFVGWRSPAAENRH